MCLEINLELGLALGTCEGVIIREDSEIWRMPPRYALDHLLAAKMLLPYAHDLETLLWYKDNDNGRFLPPPVSASSRLQEALRRMPENPLAGASDVEYAQEVCRHLYGCKQTKPLHDESQPPATQQGYVYLLAGGEYHKLGCSKDIDRRLTQIVPKMPFELELICAIATNDMYSLESNLHHRFADKRTNGEWFKLEVEDVAFIKELANAK